MKLVIDTDVGIDDAIALLMVLAYPELNLQAITAVAGNVSIDKVLHNIAVVLDVAGAPAIPIYRGCAQTLRRRLPDDAAHIHGEDGLAGLAQVATTRPVESGHASLALTDLARQFSGDLTLLTLGPLTNLALAIRLDPTFLSHLHRLVVMGGAVEARGNMTAITEFNIGADPEAAKIVFEACQNLDLAIELISWETTLDYAMTYETWRNLIHSDSPTANFVRALTDFCEVRLAPLGYTRLFWPDPLTAAVALEPEIVQREELRFVEVEASLGPARGQTMVDYRPDGVPYSNTRIIRQVDEKRFHQLLRLAINQS
ncbi:MAG TPA: nucleoside hydrolase [Anaerolineae bacterium]|nr:nucleoside hydrolase [Anaerolineae bacterium]